MSMSAGAPIGVLPFDEEMSLFNCCSRRALSSGSSTGFAIKDEQTIALAGVLPVRRGDPHRVHISELRQRTG